MSSAAKLRKYGRGTAVVASAALVMTSFGPAAFAAWDEANASQAGVSITNANQGTIGIVDTDTGANNAPADNHGATLIEAGKTGQSIADVRLVIPNRFKAGDVIDLRLFDRSATEESNGNTNAGPSTLVGFSAVPTVAVDGPQADETQVTADTESTTSIAGRAGVPVNTEADADNPWASVTGETGVAATRPGVKPTFSTQIMKSPANQGNDIVRLTVTSDPSTGDPNGTWVVSLSDLKVDLGAAVTPGELRMVPFARNVQSNTTVADEWFFGNMDKLTAADSDPAVLGATPREIGIYTVPAWVSPVTVATENQNITSDGSAQSVGKLTIGETQAISLGNGNYELELTGAYLANANASGIKATLADGGTNEQVSDVQITRDASGNGTGLTFTLNNPDPTKKATITFDGVQLRAAQPGQIQWRLSGGTVDEWLASPAGSGDAITIAGTQVAAASTAFTGAGEQATIGSSPVVTFAGNSNPTLTDAAARNAVPDSADGTYTDNGAAAVVAGDDAAKLTAEGRRALATAAYDDGDNAFYRVVDSAGDLELVKYASAADRTGNTSPTVVAEIIDGVDLDTATADGTAEFEDAFSSAVVAGDEFNVVNSSERAITFDPGVPGGPTQTLVTTTTTASGVTTQTVNGITFDAGQTFAANDVLTITRVVNPVEVAEPGVNQDDIVAPLDQLMRTGTASAGETAIGGTDRFGTARKIAKAYSAFGDTAIIVNGMNFPDALSSGFLSQREGAPILLSAQNFVPQDTLESLKERGVRKVYIVGGEAAVGSKVLDTLKATDAYGYDDAANVLKPRGSKLEVIQLGGSDRYVTNWVVNTYAAAQTANAAPVGKINVAYGQSQKTTALVARGDQFADALTANLLTAGLPGDLTPFVAGQAGSTSFTRVPAAGTLSQADLSRIVQSGNYFVTTNAILATDGAPAAATAAQTGAGRFLRLDSSTGPVVAYSADGISWTPVDGDTLAQPGGALVIDNVADGVVTGDAALVFSAEQEVGDNFAVNYTAPVGGRYEYDRSAPRRNALPVILTPGNGLHSYSKNQMNALHIQHALLIGGDAALSKQVNDDIAATGTTSYRLGGTDRFHTAQLVNMFAMADETPKADNPQYVPGLGFDGGMYYNQDGTPFSGTIPAGEATPEWVAYLANGLKFPDALVSGPWISRSRDQLLMTTGTDLTNPSRGFLTDNAEDIDRAAGLGLGNAVSSSVINEANKLASSK